MEEVTEAIKTAFFGELADVGYGRLSVDAVAKRAGVGKTAIYRRWRSKLQMAIALTADVAVAAIDVPDTGSLHTDIRQYLENGRAALCHPLACRIIPDLLAERVEELGRKSLAEGHSVSAREALLRASNYYRAGGVLPPCGSLARPGGSAALLALP